MGRELIIAADLSASQKAGRTEVRRTLGRARRSILADDSTDTTAGVATRPGKCGRGHRGLDREICGKCRSTACNDRDRADAEFTHETTHWL